MKKLVFLVAIVFVTMSSFTLSPIANCGQACADFATISANLFGEDFEYEADIFEDCFDYYCAQQ